MPDDKDKTIVKFSDKRSKPTKTIIQNLRRYGQNVCEHKGPYTVSEEEWTIECGDCGAHLNPIWCMIKLAKKEAYYSQRVVDLIEHLELINKELEGRQRTKCTHCGNMTAIKFKSSMPCTWAGR